MRVEGEPEASEKLAGPELCAQFPFCALGSPAKKEDPTASRDDIIIFPGRWRGRESEGMQSSEFPKLGIRSSG